MEAKHADPDETQFPTDLGSDVAKEKAYDLLKEIANTSRYLSVMVPFKDRTRYRMRFYQAGNQRGLRVSTVFEDTAEPEMTKLIVRTKNGWV
jgi:hypothetical protein